MDSLITARLCVKSAIFLAGPAQGAATVSRAQAVLWHKYSELLRQTTCTNVSVLQGTILFKLNFYIKFINDYELNLVINISNISKNFYSFAFNFRINIGAKK